MRHSHERASAAERCTAREAQRTKNETQAVRATGRCLIKVLQLAKREGIAKRVLKKLEALLERR